MQDSPLRDRWQPTRGGLVNLFKYENQIFRYENGRLLLRGNNGSGKSRVLALQLPFLLDGEMSPYRVEPDRDPAKKMEWHLLMDRHERRSGYTWIEFGQLENGEPRYLTLGCGMEARRGGGSPNRWFFITPQRIGQDLELVENRTPLTKRQLTDATADHGQVFERAGEYRSAVDDRLFKLGARYAPLIDLLIQLRQPQLMRDMKEDILSNALSEALPPLAEPILNEVAESFEGLDTDRQRTERFREMLDTVANFREGYRQYLAVAVRKLCGDVRVAHSQYEVANRELREIEQDLAATRETLAAAEKSRDHTAAHLARLETEMETLRSSPEMSSKRDLEHAESTAIQSERDAATAQQDLKDAEKAHRSAIAEREQRERMLEKCRADLAHAHREVTGLYETIRFGDAPLFDWQTADLQTERKEIDGLVERRRKGVLLLRQRNGEIADSHRAHQRDVERREQRHAEIVEATEKVGASESALTGEIEAFARQMEEWRKTLAVLPYPDSQDWAESLDQWIDGREGVFLFRTALGTGRDRVHAEVSAQRAGIDSERKTLEEKRSELATELEGLRRGRQPEPPVPHTRGIRPDDRPGAPFWKQFDFRDEIPADERPGWEAALESAGLLDAWVFPDGTVGEIRDDDFLAAAHGIDPANSLAAVLKPVGDEFPLQRLLQCIGNHRDSADCWIDRDGHWANGPHRGHWSKREAEFLGHGAREESRQRRIAALESEIAGIEEILRELDAQRDAIGKQLEKLDEEVRTAPSERAAVEIAVGLEHSRKALQEFKSKLIEAETAALASEKKRQERIAKRDTDAADMGLAKWAEPGALAEFEEKLGVFRDRAAGLWPAWQGHLNANAELERSRESEKTAANAREQRQERHREKSIRAQQARAKAETLFASVGASVQELVNRLKTAESAAATCRSDLEQRGNEATEAGKKLARLEERQTNAQEKRVNEETRRNHAVGRMGTFAEEQLFAELDPGYQPDRVDFSASAAVELARRLEQELKGHDVEQWNKLQSEISQRFGELSDQLGRLGHHPQLSNVDEASVYVIRCDFRGETRTLLKLHELVAAELENRRRIFEEREREVIENHLIGEAANELQKRIRDGEQWVVSVNEELSRVTTSSGIQLKFDWGLAAPDDEMLKSVRGLFLKTSAAWSPREREAIGAFLQSRIRAAREEDDTAGWREQLGRALDYRAWHRFGILRRSGNDSTWKKLTRQTFGTGSGGEKAMTLTLPQFAAAAAHYQSAHPHAPRLILLDEVFVGIDSATRARLMGLLETFDLDYVMTSEREWGFYPTVSALAVYQLATRRDLNAVAVTRWVWNGKEKFRDDG